jgi:hypothetical protein
MGAAPPGALAIGILDAEDEPAAVTAGVEPVEECRARAADVQVARRAGREARPDGHRRRKPEALLQVNVLTSCAVCPV